MKAAKTPVLWTTGAPGSGKSTIAWGLYTRIVEAGGNVAYVDIDQLGLIGPPPGGGDAAHAIKAANLLRVLEILRRRGAEQLVVSGVVDLEIGVEPSFEGRDFDLTLVRLTCDRDELRSRFLGRGSPAAALPALEEVADAYDRTGFGEKTDTTGQSPEKTVEDLFRRCVVEDGPVLPPSAVEPQPGPVTVVTGPTAVGKSTAAWSVLRDFWQRETPVAYVDLAQFGFVSPGPDPAVEAANLAAVWRGHREAGARRLLVVAREFLPEHRKAFEDVTVVHLDADAETLTERVRRRAEGESALLAGDELRGAPPGVRDRVAARAITEAARARSSRGDSVVLDTSGQEPAETAAALLAAVRQ
ncbi:AAA family ATPase [Amycolatopsis umgeniensis]|uniref:Energy-coupling factor transporter ATP-binding protein EcfA2 n=1 Tax=Amycolatopsis umgeniensis TaxID=336628 RepID=A0A841B578_9PSEU|nr:AAA family ATPase [Amycolatopsis umgeniensis]MBB5853618.1 energy-coupling factor transporter ATP-binding protein EcfA2 [Amycolatopsis umgeniensis]